MTRIASPSTDFLCVFCARREPCFEASRETNKPAATCSQEGFRVQGLGSGVQGLGFALGLRGLPTAPNPQSLNPKANQERGPRV